MKKFLLFLTVIAVSFQFSFVLGQDEPISPSIIGTGTYHGLTPPLRDLPTITESEFQQMMLEGENKILNPELEEREYPFEATALPNGPDEAWQKQMGTTPNPKAPILNFSGQTSPYYPPDCNGTVGPNHFMQTINTVYAIYNNTTGALVAGPTNMNVLFSGVTGATCNDGDPLVLYDEQANRWLAVEFSICGSNDYMLVAVSQTSDPTGSWYKYSFDVADMPDYEKFGIWRDGYYMGTNNSSGNDIYVFQRDQMLIGGTAQFVGFNNAWRPSTIDGFMCVPPLDNDGAFAPVGSPGLFITINDDAIGGGSDQLWIYELAVNWSSPGSSTFNRVQQLGVASFDSNFGNNWDNIKQLGTTRELDAIPMVIMNIPQYRNFGSYQTIVCCHTVDVDATDHAGIRWYELRRTTGNWSIRQYGTYAPDAHSRWMGSIALNGSNELGLGYSVSSSTMYPGIRYCGQSAATYNAASGLSSLDIAESVIQNGSNSQTAYNRWGDYSAISVDPDDDHTFWFTTQYGGSRQTKIASFQLSTPSSPPVANFSADNTLPVNSTTTVNFSNLTTGSSPLTYSWSFSPNTVTYVGGSNSSSQNPSVRFNNPGAYTVTLYVQNSFGNDTEVKTDYIHMGQPGVWKGTTSTNWDQATNWDNYMIPVSSTDVFIYPTAFNWPEKSGNFTLGTDCNNLVMTSGTELTVIGNLTINSGKTLNTSGATVIKIGGNWTNNGTFNAGSGSIEYIGSSSSIIHSPAGAPAYLINDGMTPWPGNWNGDVSGGAGYFGLSATTNAGGTSPEAKFTRNGTVLTTTRRMYYDPVNTSGLTSATLVFKHYVDRRNSPNYTLTAQYSTNGTSWTNIPGWSVTNPPADFGATVTLPLTSSQGIGAANYYIAFAITGQIRSIDAWYIDNVSLSYITSGVENFHNLVINKSGSTVTTNGNVNVNANFTIKPGASFTNSPGNLLSVDGSVLFMADASGMASFIDNGTSIFSIPPAIQQYLINDKWHFVSTPVFGAQSGVYTGIYLRAFDEPTDSWGPYILPTSDPLSIMKGYAAWAATMPATVVFNGPLNNGPLNIPVTRNSTQTNFGWNLVGNPYPSSLDWDATGWTKTNIDNTIYYYSGNAGLSNYHYYVGSATAPYTGVAVNDGTNEIPPHQGFFVHVSTGNTSGTLGVSNLQRIHSGQAFYKNSADSANFPIIRLLAEGAGLKDETVVRFFEGASPEFDSSLDAYKLFADNYPQVYTTTLMGTELAINTMSEITNDLVVPVSFIAPSDDTYTFSFTQLTGFDQPGDLYFEDLLENNILEVDENSTYSFVYASENINNRFLLHFSNPLGINETSSDNFVIYSFEGVIYIKTSDAQRKDVSVFNMIGQKVFHRTISENGIHRISLSGNMGYYLVKVQSGDQLKTKKVFLK